MIVAERQTDRVLGRRVIGRAPRAFVFALKRRSPPVAFDVDFEDRCVMDQPIHGGQRHRGIWENLAPRAERLVGGDEGGAAFVTRADQLEQNRGLSLILTDIGEVIKDQQVEAVEPADGGLKAKFAARDLEFLYKVGGAGEQHAPAVFDESEAERCRKVALAAAWRGRDMVPDTRSRARRFTTPFIRIAGGESQLCGVIRSAASRCW